ncbi:MAG: DinB family protein [Acidobacteriota bacterium]|nr:DinB family protein [Acidobacteriota bacterium]
MKLTEMFLGQLERETPITRRALERVPPDRAQWKPHPKSMALGNLASLIASMPSWIATMIEKDELDIGAGEGGSAPTSTNRELIELLDKSIDTARRALSNTTDEHLMTRWKLRFGERILSEAPRYVMISGAVLSHLAHHRGQLTVYLRMNGIKVPVIYGATADEAH